MQPAPPGWGEAERAARESYGRLVAWLAYRWHDLAAAQDAMSEALVAALTHWPRTGVPDSPDAWLLTAARRHLLQTARHTGVTQAPEVLALLEPEPEAAEALPVPDERLKLMFVCAHPALPSGVHAPLMLQVVLGLDAARIAQAFLSSPSAMAQRLVRAKARIREAGLRYDEPEARELPQRLAAVLDGLYGAYTIGSNVACQGPDAAAASGGTELTTEAVFLARLVVQLQPDSAEALGLLALMLYCEARRGAQFDPAGRFVALTGQDTARWDRELIRQAEHCLWCAASLRQPGSFQIEAAIQSAHCQRAFTGQTPWPAIAKLYEALVLHFPSIGARIGHAVALAESGDGPAGLRALQALPADEVKNHQPYWVALAWLLQLGGDAPAARAALERALGLTADARVREHLARQSAHEVPTRPP